MLRPRRVSTSSGNKSVSHKTLFDIFRVGLWQNGFFADFYFWAAGFFRGFSRRIFSPHFCGKKCPEKSSRKIPGKILQNLCNKNPPTHFCRGAGPTFFAQGKKRQKSSKSVKNIFDTFRQFSRSTSFPAPFGGALMYVCRPVPPPPSQTIVAALALGRSHTHTFRSMSETPTTTTSQKSIANTPPMCIAIRLQFVSQCFRCPYALSKGKYCQCSSHLYRSTPPICIAVRLPFVSQCFWENLGGCGHRDVPHT